MTTRSRSRSINAFRQKRIRKVFHRGFDRGRRRRASARARPRMIAAVSRLRKHADYQRVYSASRKQFSRQMSYFFAPRVDAPECSPGDMAAGPRVGLTVGKAMGKAVERNRIKRRMREAVRRNLALLVAPVDVVLHPRRAVLDLEFAELEREIAHVFRAIQKFAMSAPRPSPAKIAEPAS